MLRRQFLAAFAPPIRYRDYSRCLPDYLRRIALDSYAARNRALAKLTTPQAIAQRQRWARETFWRLTGGPLERTPLHLKTTGSFERAAYKVDKLIYESRPGLHVTANLYLPKSGRPPYPGVLFQMGHSLNGKAASLYQYCCQGLVQLGFAVLAFDPMGQGERTYYPRPGANLTRLGSADDEHTLPGRQLLLTGDTSTRFQTWDAIRSLDVLASHPLVDPKRLASTGNSGGGTLTMFLACTDERLACAAVACGNTENLACANFNPPGSTDDAEQNFISSAAPGFDRWDTLYPMAAKPLLMLASAKDFFGTYSPRYMENGREEFAKLGRVYSVLGRATNLEWFETPLPHGLSYDLRMAIYRFFRRHLQGIMQPLDQEPPASTEPDDQLYASPTGNTARDFGGLTPHKLALANSAQIQTPVSVTPSQIEQLLAVDRPAAALVSKGSTASRGLKIEAIEVQSAPEVWVPAWLFHPSAARDRKTLLVLADPRGRNASWNEEGLCQSLAAAGYTVCATDVRAIGDLRPEFPRHAPQHARSHQEEEAYAWASLCFGKPLLGQRVTDLLAVIRSIPPRTRTVLAASGTMTAPALFAAALEPAVSVVYLAGGIRSFRSLLEMEEPRHTFADYLFDVLRHADIPQVEASLTGRLIRAAAAEWSFDALARL